jgi:hypothetical protein
MELLIFVAALCVMGFLAMRYGHDSREPAESKEQTWASLGLRLDHAGSTQSDVHPSTSRSTVQSESPHQRTGATPQPVGTSMR